MVCLHGGSYFRGASSQPLFDATTLAENGDVVVVSINYRIGVFGFVDFSSFNSSEHTFEPNVALRDMIAALQWVRSEEHTSELQSLMRISYAVFCLKKKIKKHKQCL